MQTLKNNIIHYSYSFCQQCGVCKAVCPNKAISFESLDNGLKRIVVNELKCIVCKKCVRVCPANRKLKDEDYLDRLTNKKFFFAYNESRQIRHESSSGDACKTLIIEKSGVVDGVYSLRKLENYPSCCRRILYTGESAIV